MTEHLAGRLDQLEKSVKRAAETIARLKAERDALAARITALEADRAELATLRQERKDVLAQLDGMLKELDRLEL
jgi:septal ring factor EnvC (AmiA/AmiB activator)